MTGVFTIHNNHPPVLDPIGDKIVKVKNLLEFTISASDPDGDTLVYSSTKLPRGATFDLSTHTFSWIPNSRQSGIYNVRFEVTDGKGGIDYEDISITVTKKGGKGKGKKNK